MNVGVLVLSSLRIITLKYKDSCADDHLKLDVVVKERDELSKLMESMNRTEEAKVIVAIGWLHFVAR